MQEVCTHTFPRRLILVLAITLWQIGVEWGTEVPRDRISHSFCSGKKESHLVRAALWRPAATSCFLSSSREPAHSLYLSCIQAGYQQSVAFGLSACNVRSRRSRTWKRRFEWASLLDWSDFFKSCVQHRFRKLSQRSKLDNENLVAAAAVGYKAVPR